VDSARANLAGTFVNAFVNAAFGNDDLMVEAEEGESWIYKNKDHGVVFLVPLCRLSVLIDFPGMMSAAASLGLILLWDTEVGLSHVDRYTYSSEEYIKVSSRSICRHRTSQPAIQAGALFATGLLHTGVHNEADPPIALLADYVNNRSVTIRTGAIMGLGFAYAGTNREDLIHYLLQPLADDRAPMEVTAITALALGFILVGSGNGEIASTILQIMMERDDKALDEKWSRFLALGLGLLYLGLMVSFCCDGYSGLTVCR
jgi:26S proteasome regulatory subunit N1